jgi:hypothetical protein
MGRKCDNARGKCDNVTHGGWGVVSSAFCTCQLHPLCACDANKHCYGSKSPLRSTTPTETGAVCTALPCLPAQLSKSNNNLLCAQQGLLTKDGLYVQHHCQGGVHSTGVLACQQHRITRAAPAVPDSGHATVKQKTNNTSSDSCGNAKQSCSPAAFAVRVAHIARRPCVRHTPVRQRPAGTTVSNHAQQRRVQTVIST